MMVLENKLANLILYIADKCQDDPHFGAIKLNKILFAADFFAYGYLGQSISQATYQHWDLGPVPKELQQVRDKLIRDGAAIQEERMRFSQTQHRIVSQVNADLSEFTKDEIGIVDEVIEEFKPMNARQLSEWTHTLRPWLSTSRNENIPYETIFTWKDCEKVPVERAALEWGLTRIEQLEAQGVL